MSSPIMRYFACDHLPERLQLVSRPFCEFAAKMDAEIPDSRQKEIGMQRLLEAKDCLVRASLEP